MDCKSSMNQKWISHLARIYLMTQRVEEGWSKLLSLALCKGSLIGTGEVLSKRGYFLLLFYDLAGLWT